MDPWSWFDLLVVAGSLLTLLFGNLGLCAVSGSVRFLSDFSSGVLLL